MTALQTELEQWMREAPKQPRAVRALRGVKQRFRPVEAPKAVLLWPAGRPEVLVVADKLTASCAAAVWAPLEHLDPVTTAVIAPEDAPTPPGYASHERREHRSVDALPGTITEVLSLGGYLPWSREVLAWSRQTGARFTVVQHGLLTPFAPPAPANARVLAWSEEDAEVWSRGRTDLDVGVVGSQLLWREDAQPAAPVRLESDRPVMLGQLHGTELGRRGVLCTYVDFARSVPSDYRPHPNEVDLASRALHVGMRTAGVSLDRSGGALTDLRRPVVSIFSTGVLEAAANGLPAWVTHSDPPPWLIQFWHRYGMSRFGEDATPAWNQVALEPARAVAEALS